MEQNEQLFHALIECKNLIIRICLEYFWAALANIFLTIVLLTISQKLFSLSFSLKSQQVMHEPKPGFILLVTFI